MFPPQTMIFLLTEQICNNVTIETQCNDIFYFKLSLNNKEINPNITTNCSATFLWYTEVNNDDHLNYLVTPELKFKYLSSSSQLTFQKDPDNNVVIQKMVVMAPAYYELTIQTAMDCNNEKYDIDVEIITTNGTHQKLQQNSSENCRASYKFTSFEHEMQSGDTFSYQITAKDEIAYTYQTLNNTLDPEIIVLKNFSKIETATMKPILYEVVLLTDANCSSDVIDYALEIRAKNGSLLKLLSDRQSCSIQFQWTTQDVAYSAQNSIIYSITAASNYTAFRFYNQSKTILPIISQGKNVYYEQNITLQTAQYNVSFQTAHSCINETFVFGLYVVQPDKTEIWVNPVSETNCSANYSWSSSQLYLAVNYSFKYSITPLSRIQFKYKHANGTVVPNITTLSNITIAEKVKFQFINYNVSIQSNADCLKDNFDFNLKDLLTSLSLTVPGTCNATVLWTSEAFMINQENIFFITMIPTSDYTKQRYFKTQTQMEFWCSAGEDKNDSIKTSPNVATYDIIVKTLEVCRDEDYLFKLYIVRSHQNNVEIVGKLLERCKAQFKWTSIQQSLQTGDFFEVQINSIDQYKYQSSKVQLEPSITTLANYSVEQLVPLYPYYFKFLVNTTANCELDTLTIITSVINENKTVFMLNKTCKCNTFIEWTSLQQVLKPSYLINFTVTPNLSSQFRFFEKNEIFDPNISKPSNISSKKVDIELQSGKYSFNYNINTSDCQTGNFEISTQLIENNIVVKNISSSNECLSNLIFSSLDLNLSSSKQLQLTVTPIINIQKLKYFPYKNLFYKFNRLENVDKKIEVYLETSKYNVVVNVVNPQQNEQQFKFALKINRNGLKIPISGNKTSNSSTLFNWSSSDNYLMEKDVLEYSIEQSSANIFKFFNMSGQLDPNYTKLTDLNLSVDSVQQNAFHSIQLNVVNCVKEQFNFRLDMLKNNTKVIQLEPTKVQNCSSLYQWSSVDHLIDPTVSFQYFIEPRNNEPFFSQNGTIQPDVKVLGNYSTVVSQMMEYNGMKGPEIAGIAIGAVVGAGLIAAGLIIFWRRRHIKYTKVSADSKVDTSNAQLGILQETEVE